MESTDRESTKGEAARSDKKPRQTISSAQTVGVSASLHSITAKLSSKTLLQKLPYIHLGLKRANDSVTNPVATKIHENQSPVQYCGLQNLPFELIILIVESLDKVSTICLASTNRHFRNTIPSIPPRDRRPCVRWLLMCQVEKDSKSPPQSFPCAFCKVRRPLADFTGTSLRRALSNDHLKKSWCIDPEIIDFKPIARYCFYHAPLTAWVDLDPSAGLSSDEHPVRWTRVRKLRCMHCGESLENADYRQTGCANCECDVCPRILHYAYIRYGPRNTRFARRPYIDTLGRSKDGDGRFVTESGSMVLLFFVLVIK